MTEKYDFAEIESRWQDHWLKNGFYRSPSEDGAGKKFYALDMFAYTSGSMHMGNARTCTMGDVIARYRKRQGYRLLHPRECYCQSHSPNSRIASTGLRSRTAVITRVARASSRSSRSGRSTNLGPTSIIALIIDLVTHAR